MEGRYSTRSPAVKRLMREAQELCEPTDQYFAQPLEDNLFEWHFTIRGPLDSDFQAGVYHGRIILPVDYPMKPPSIIWLTPNGRFETNKKICLSISGHHPESWQPSWSIRTALLAIIGFMPTHPGGAIGSLDYKPEERKTLAKKSRDWKCPVCGDISEILLEPNPESSHTSQEAKELATQISFQGEKPKSPDNKVTPEAAVTSSTSPPPVVTGAEGTSNNASTHAPSSAPPNEPFSPAASFQNPGNFLPPWSYPPTSSTLLPPFLHYPWASHMTGYGQQVSCLAAQIPRFPYPPSHYTVRDNSNFYPPGFALPPGIGMFPCPFPPPPLAPAERYPPNPSRNVPASVNNSSISPPNGNLSHPPGVSVVPNIPHPPPADSNLVCAPDSSQHKEDKTQPIVDTHADTAAAEVSAPISARTDNKPVNSVADGSSKSGESATVVPGIDNAGLDLVSSLISESSPSQNVSSAKTEDVLSLKRDVGGDQNYSTGFQPNSSQAMDVASISRALTKAFDSVEAEAGELKCDAAAELPQVAGNDQSVGDHCQVEDGADKSQVTDAVSISASLMKKDSSNESTGMEISHSELLADVEGDDDSRLLAVQFADTEQRSHFERSTSSSMPELKMNNKQASPKGLRQRQSATDYVPTDVAADQTPSEQANSGGIRQRIEAVSGDSSQANQPRFANDMHQVNDAGHNAHLRQRRGQANSPYDTSFFIMIGLCLTTMFIIFNRLFHMVDLSDLFK